MTNEASSPGIAPNSPDLDLAYVGAPSVNEEIGWLGEHASGRAFGQEQDREFLLRKAAVMDRIALKEEAAYAPEVAAESMETADQAALQLIEYDVAHTGLSLKGAELITGSDHREYVRQEYRAWS